MTRGTHHRATPVCTVPARPRLLLLSHAPAACLCRITAIAAAPPPHPPYITASPQTPPFSHIIPYPHPQLARAAPRIPAPDPVGRHETPDPLRSNAMDSRFHCVRRPASGALRTASGSRPPRHPLRATHPCETRVPTDRTPNPNPNRAQPLIRGKPFLTASNTPADYAELPTARPSPERIEGVSRSLPFSDLLALTSSHMFFSVMN